MSGGSGKVMNRCIMCLKNSSAEEIELSRRSKKIDRELRKDERMMRRQVKLLLLGAGESGKSTFLKQMRIIHNKNYDITAQLDFRKVIYQNIIKGMKVLVDANRKLGIPLSNPTNKQLGEQLLLFDSDSNIDNQMFPQFKTMLSSLWTDQGIKTAFLRRNEFQLSDSVQYFLDNLPRIAVADYVPTLKDILYCRKTTKGVIEFNIEIDKVPFLFVDVGGQRTQRQKWFQCFESVTAILFLASTSEYDQVLLEDRRTNRLEESRKIFDTIVNNKIFSTISVILFLNKMDLLETKVKHSDISKHFEDFREITLVGEYAPGFGGEWSDIEDVKKFILYYFLSARRLRQKPLYHHFTTAVDTNNIKTVFRDVKDTILKKNLDALLLQ
jgi:guanine nucleotide-binding protein subunit alpha-12